MQVRSKGLSDSEPTSRRQMATDVFVGYCDPEATRDLAYRLCAHLEQRGLRCWIAPRDLEAGPGYFERKLDAVSASRLFVALITSRIRSAVELATEVKNAERRAVPVLAVQLTPNLPSDPLTTATKRRTSDWLDVSVLAADDQIARITERVEQILKMRGGVGYSISQGASRPPGSVGRARDSAWPAAYEGPEPYIFVSYKREDAERIHGWLRHLTDLGFNCWYDKGIPGGVEWDALIEEKVRSCRVVLLFLSKAATKSKYVRREVKFGDRLDKPIVTVRLEPVELQSGLDMLLSESQILDEGAPDFAEQLAKALGLAGQRR
jgi:hypothetical protein